jgi:hypothetical protein
MLNRIQIRKMTVGTEEKYKAQAGNIYWIAGDQDQETISNIMKGQFSKCKVTTSKVLDAYEVMDSIDALETITSYRKKAKHVCGIFHKKQIAEFNRADVKERFGIELKNQSARTSFTLGVEDMGWVVKDNGPGKPVSYHKPK